jgi:hypothetical protein
VDAALGAALARPEPEPSGVTRHVYATELQLVGGLAPAGGPRQPAVNRLKFSFRWTGNNE